MQPNLTSTSLTTTRLSTLRLSHIAWPVSALGPGHRLVIWTAGCPLDCSKCITPELQALDSGKCIDVDILFEHIKSIDCVFDGITITGGEPFIQSASIELLCKQLKKQFPKWDLIIFSGYYLPHWQQHKTSDSLLKIVDILIAGPYEADKPSQRPLIASSNQSLICLSDKGEKLLLKIEQQKEISANIGIARNNNWLIGIMDNNKRNLIHKHCQLKKTPAKIALNKE
jgi:anaerobic ribonucleoside-triphosphate reductase activating protein